MVKFHGLIFALLGSVVVTSILAQTQSSNKRRSIKAPTSATFLLSNKDNGAATHIPLRASALSGGNTDDEKPKFFVGSIAVGAVTAAMGFMYGKMLSLGFTVIWKKFPALILAKCGSLDAAYFITGVCTFGGLLMGIVSSKFSTTFTVADFVHAFSSAPVQKLPSSTIHLFPLLLMSFITSTFGFSLGPEAPMVCAGALIGSSMSRRWYGDSHRHQEVLSYAGAAGALTAFMGIPIAGSIFAIEMTRPNAGLSDASGHSLTPAVVSSIAAIALLRGVLLPNSDVGGHFDYGHVGKISGRAMMATAIACGAGGALLGTAFHKVVHKLKKITWPEKGDEGDRPWVRQIWVKTLVGLIVGIMGTNYPQTLFWGEGSLQSAIDGQKTAFAATDHGLVDLLTSRARVDPNVPYRDGFAAAQVGVVKMAAIMLACIGKFPGGIIFPLFFAATPFAHIFSARIGENLTSVAVFCLMAATQASVTRTPLATVLILSLSATSATDLSVMLPASLVSSYLGVFFSRELSGKSYFSYNE